METLSRCPSDEDTDLVLSLPTRNGNKQGIDFVVIQGDSFKPTYKEWKLLSQNNTPGSAEACFEPTYKEWKLRREREEFKAKFSFEPTYKEWKQYYWLLNRVLSQVLSLPTRNGNNDARRIRLSLWLVLSLPTRNGNGEV